MSIGVEKRKASLSSGSKRSKESSSWAQQISKALQWGDYLEQTANLTF